MDGQRSRADCFAYWNCDPIFGSKYLEANIDGPVCKDDHNDTGTDGCELLQKDEDGHNVTQVASTTYCLWTIQVLRYDITRFT